MRLASPEDREVADFEAQMDRENKQRSVKVIFALTVLVLVVVGVIFGLASTMNVLASFLGV
jgi:cell division septal protein FtsQ